MKPEFGQVLLRVGVDYTLVHLSMLAALPISVFSYVTFGNWLRADQIGGYFPRYYGTFFWPLSLLFPLVFYLNGFYSRSRTYTARYKAVVILRGVAMSVLLFLSANYLFFREDLVSRSVALWFSTLLMITVTAARFLKALVMSRFDITAKSRAPATPIRVPTVLVVGGAGYIGSILVRRLLDMGHKVRLLDNLVYGYDCIRDVLHHPNLELMVGDCRNIQTVVCAVKGVDSIIHLAAIVGDPACELDRQTALEINYSATRMLLEVAKGHGIGRFLFASSCSVYGASDVMADEESATQPISLYAQTKVDSETALLRARSDTFHPTILRLATVFGNSYRPRFDLVVNLLTAKAYQEGVITIYNGQQWRPFIHVRDVAEGLLAALNAPLAAVSGQIFNLGDSRLNYTLTQVADHIREVFPGTQVEHIDNADRRNYRVSFDKIANLVGFRCHWTLQDGILELKRAFEQKQILDYKDIYYSNKKFLETAGSPGYTDEMDGRVMAAFAGTPDAKAA